uniref:Uncharacterized protein n=1 Tax=Anguilla anguilla TaxID=7936 RepID=A0A0E9VDC1_ANGAN
MASPVVMRTNPNRRPSSVHCCLNSS